MFSVISSKTSFVVNGIFSFIVCALKGSIIMHKISFRYFIVSDAEVEVQGQS